MPQPTFTENGTDPGNSDAVCHLERLPAYTPEPNPGEGVWPERTGVELRHVCGFNLPHLRQAAGRGETRSP